MRPTGMICVRVHRVPYARYATLCGGLSVSGCGSYLSKLIKRSTVLADARRSNS